MLRPAAILAVISLAAAARAQTPGFWFLPVQSGERDVTVRTLSRDGTRAGGSISYLSNAPANPFLWTETGGRQVMPLGPAGQGGEVDGMSADAQITVGTLYQGGVTNSHRPYRRVGSAAAQVIGPPAGFTYGTAVGTSDDGNVIAGTWWQVVQSSSTPQAFAWTPNGGTVLLGQIGYQSQAAAVSRDGTTVVGFTDGAGFVWTQELGFRFLPGPPGAADWAARAVNSSGTIIAGYVDFSGTSSGIVRWVDGVAQPLAGDMTPVAVSDDGSVIAGNSLPHPYVWSERFGFLGAADYFQASAAPLPAGLTMYALTAMSSDGLTFAGRGNLSGIDGGFVVTVPVACGSADFNNDGDTGTDLDIEFFFACIAGDCCPTCGSADFNGDGDLATDADIEAFFRVLAGGSC